ncbi:MULTISPECIES: hypothetical protein [unclassified Duganella]|jgi:hypothetical protein|uniref:hypothetical protein n=1 Tax=unclassified Duganella TaxID=2636909 RepID=UPI0008810BF4|nr:MULTISPECIES: hypothetical protein [unclassified Duganella]SDF63646.1 hypothetical protein SAMN05216320_101830 [Duganella sp. OV458]SDI64818.1 hypothetical protein SAMN05428973_101585 [Duganella sp. OV510]
MTVLFRSIVVWLVLLALPYQGYAAAQMMLCAAPVPAPASHAAMVMPSGPHDHAAMMASMAQAESKADDGASSHTSMKCSGSACCAAAAPVLTLDISNPALPVASRLVPFYSGFLPAVDLANPERPPQGRYA